MKYDNMNYIFYACIPSLITIYIDIHWRSLKYYCLELRYSLLLLVLLKIKYNCRVCLHKTTFNLQCIQIMDNWTSKTCKIISSSITTTQLCRFIWIGCINTQQKNKKMSFWISIYSEMDFMQVTYVIFMIKDYIQNKLYVDMP